MEALHEAGLPKGVLNFVAGSGGELGSALVAAKPLKAGDLDANRYPAEYRKLISKYFESVAEGK